MVDQLHIGRFRISLALVLSDATGAQSHMALAMLDGCLVIETRRTITDEIEYTALHPGFDPVQLGEEPPIYRRVFYNDPDGHTTSKWERWETRRLRSRRIAMKDLQVGDFIVERVSNLERTPSGYVFCWAGGKSRCNLPDSSVEILERE